MEVLLPLLLHCVLATAGKFLMSNILPKVLPSLAQGASAEIGSAAASNILDKISGTGVLYLKKNGMAKVSYCPPGPAVITTIFATYKRQQIS